MGNSHKKPQDYQFVNQFVKTEWAREQNIGKCELWLNVKSNQICQAYRLNSFPSQEDFQRYEFRNHNNKDIVKVMFVDIQKSQNICSGNDEAIVLTEHIPVRLSQINNISVLEGYSILKSAYSGFNIITSFYGPLKIDQDMIGFNKIGKTKVWLNNNYSKNYAQKAHQTNFIQQIDKITLNDNQIQHILQMVQEKLAQKRFPLKFRQTIYDNKFNYFQAANYIDQYCQNQRIGYPQNIQIERYIKNLRSNSNANMNTNNSTSQVQVLYKNMVLTKSNSVNNLITQNKSPLLLRQNTQYRTLIPRQNSTILSPSFNKNVVFGTKKVNVTFGSPQIIKNQTMQFQNRPSLPIQQIKQIVKQPPLRINSNLQTTPKYVGNNLKFISPGKITQFQQPIYRQVSSKQQKKNLISNAQITESQNIKVQMKDKKQPLQNPLEHSEGKAEQINQLHKYLDQEVLKYPNQQQFQMANSFGIPTNTLTYNKRKNEEAQQSDYQKSQNSENVDLMSKNEDNSQREDQQQNYQREIHANQFAQHERQPHHQCQIQQKIHHKTSKDSNDHYHYDQYQNQNQNIYNHELNQFEKQFHQKHCDDNDDEGQHHEQYQEQQQHQQYPNQNSQNKQQVYQNHQEQQDNFCESYQNQAYYLDNNHHQHLEELQENYQNMHHKHHKQSNYNQQNYLSSEEVIPPHQPQQQSQYYYHQFKKYAAPQKPSSPSHLKHQSDYQNQNQFINSSREQTNRQADSKSSGTLIVHQSKQNVYSVSNNLSKNVSPNHSNQYKQVNSEGQDDDYNPSASKNNQVLQNPVQVQKMHYRQQSDQLVQYIPVDSVFNRNQERQTDQINRLQRPEDIENYIRNKYKDYLRQEKQSSNQNIQRKNSQNGRTLTFAKQPSNQIDYKLQNFATNVQSKYQAFETFVPNKVEFSKSNNGLGLFQAKSESDQQDFLDIKNLQKSLDQKYSKLSHQQKLKAKKSQTSQEGFDVALLEKKLQKFEQNRQSQSIVKSSQLQKQELFKEDNLIQMMDKRIQQSQKKNVNKDVDILGGVKLEESVSGFTQIPILKAYEVQGSSASNSKQGTGRQNQGISSKLSGKYVDSIINSGSFIKKPETSAYQTYTNSYLTQKYQSQPIDKFNSTSSFQAYKYADFKKKPSIKNINLTTDYGNYDNSSGYEQSSRRSSRRQSAKDALKLASQMENKYQKYSKKSSQNQNSFDNMRVKSKYDTNSYISDIQIDSNPIKQRTLNRKQSPSYLKTINQMLNPSLDASPIKQNQNFNKFNQSQSGYNLQLKSYDSYETKSKQNSKKSIEEQKKPGSRVSYDQLRNLLWK